MKGSLPVGCCGGLVGTMVVAGDADVDVEAATQNNLTEKLYLSFILCGFFLIEKTELRRKQEKYWK